MSAKQGGTRNGSPVGISVTDSTLETNSVTLRAETTNINNSSYVFGLYILPNGNGSTINLTDTSILVSGEIRSYGLYYFAQNSNMSLISFKNCSIYATSKIERCFSLFTLRLPILTIDNCSLTHVYTGTDPNSFASALAWGSAPVQVNISNASINAEAKNGGRAYGFEAYSTVNLNISHSEVTSISVDPGSRS